MLLVLLVDRVYVATFWQWRGHGVASVGGGWGTAAAAPPQTKAVVSGIAVVIRK